jgi:hypothetical protein
VVFHALTRTKMADRAWLSPLFDAWKRFRLPLASTICFQCFARDFGRFQNVRWLAVMKT